MQRGQAVRRCPFALLFFHQLLPAQDAANNYGTFFVDPQKDTTLWKL
ncbi:hypothetical protein B0I18_109153 [Taibaiella chishuiensis]|uniref:Uncharacterized protein n=1 Tax=Taibaiella chishuiensis TaxID=1434707 RepID=A0A2P8CYY5_9BACT|nr:hypothetical protein B0I18_109153 [Taibaiella chishuiensis]